MAAVWVSINFVQIQPFLDKGKLIYCFYVLCSKLVLQVVIFTVPEKAPMLVYRKVIKKFLQYKQDVGEHLMEAYYSSELVFMKLNFGNCLNSLQSN